MYYSFICMCFFNLYRYYLYILSIFFFFKQKTAYEMRISDWSSDVCSSDLTMKACENYALIMASAYWRKNSNAADVLSVMLSWDARRGLANIFFAQRLKIGRASCRERVCQYV